MHTLDFLTDILTGLVRSWTAVVFPTPAEMMTPPTSNPTNWSASGLVWKSSSSLKTENVSLTLPEPAPISSKRESGRIMRLSLSVESTVPSVEVVSDVYHRILHENAPRMFHSDAMLLYSK